MYNILVVDDESMLAQLYKFFLEDVGYNVNVSYGGRDALQQIEEQLPDLVLLDVMMPGMDGFEVCRQIRRKYKSPRPFVLMFTADDRELTRHNGLLAGADGVLTKAIPIHHLPDYLNEYLSAT